MNIDRLIEMANQISTFFASESLPGRASADVATHLRRYWEPRMRAQIVTYYHERQGAGLGDIALGAVGLLADEAKAKAAAQVPSPG
ncbi:MAG TPA: formate dehydrogenase subunit delta [Steroidobacteraceae bacterium]|nr:formate dehydrogenase subunit delta [Steroidobacteraceae bacterium]